MTLEIPEQDVEIVENLRRAALKSVEKEIDEFTKFEEGPGSMSLQQKLGVLQRMVTAVSSDKEYLQVLLLAAFDDKQEALLCADAISERQRYGVLIQPILTRVVAQCAVKSGRVDRILHAMNNYTINSRGGGMPEWKRRQESKTLGG